MTTINNNMPDWWIETTLGEVIATANTWLDAIKRAPIVSENTWIKCFRIQDASQSKDYNNWGFTKVDTNNYKRFQLLRWDILIARTWNSIWVNFLVKEDTKAVFNNWLIRLRVNNKADFWFLYKVIVSDIFNKHIQSIAYWTSTQPNMQIQSLLNFTFLLPPLPEQQAIASILSSFDDKIELLREQNKTLETMAQTIFKEWFGKYSVGDELPDGWRIEKLGEEFDISIWRTPPRLEIQWFSTNSKDVKWISIKDIWNSWTYIFETSEYLTQEAIRKFNIPVIPENTTILSFKMTVWKLVITTEKMLSNEAIAHLKVKNNSNISSEFIYCYLQNLDFNSLWSTSSIVTAINSTMIKDLEIVIPENKLLQEFNEIIKPIFEKIKQNTIQIKTLSKTRDELLPKLMSGKVRIV